ncbi:hypothetical protein [Abyssisolibacter fermentans]|uniref:hypothetical protein n=1 Tax=Abyssisolibacter fermentans TaxID=1766203 RepID=UPI00082D8469|nr:hypothetical protein [Abyssisolibacter fermentans]
MENKIIINRITTISNLISTAVGTVLADLLTLEQQNFVGNYLQGISQVLLAVNAQEALLESQSSDTSSLASDIAMLKEKIDRLEKIIEGQIK